MNLPNMLTGVRFLLIPVYVVIFLKGHLIPAFLVIAAAGITDVLDGYIARSRGLVTSAGALLDPLADKLMFLTVFGSLVLYEFIPWSAALALIIRDAGLIAGSALFHFQGKRTIPANRMGKITTVLLYAAIMFIFFDLPYAQELLWGVVGFSFVTAFLYVMQILSVNKVKAEDERRDVSGPA
ncbi:CDP-diacylglycerol--glycerol-3-phosphate 3-phosphatidyltransferase [Paenibacillus sambharensis]|uniref:CDP-diacylglycerol--glycerol-3-phosphate 3-phosphatidyltransferase n=1 Tax=Paenibacillus sambharensis TaxID=1803190 RepID=A0A2W1LS60_9BACL|nr:CDP-alcohol phosphatidyltransferase family protein [Paenibacillus sambharensis]PZD97812.1 CDP-diacylglycerol--glycerol-3-phosphate 3-phosphatidyltransferase [Paenibacillus sambharensis]